MADETLASLVRFEGRAPVALFSTRHVADEDARDAAAFVFPPLGASGIVGEDDRELVTSPSRAPYRFVCAIKALARDGKTTLRGTGWLIGPRTVITAAHCLVPRPLGAVPKEPYHGRVKEVTVTPALDGQEAPMGSAETDSFEVPAAWEAETPDLSADFGVIFLKDDCFADAGCCSFGAPSPELIGRLKLNIVGYPDDRDRGTRQYQAGRVADRIEGGRIVYETDTYQGQSGAPIWVNVGGRRVVVGVHTMGLAHLAVNSGVLVTPRVFEVMRGWKKRGS